MFFYVLMQGAMWLGTQDDPHHLPRPGELQMTEVFGCFHLLVSGEKMSKSRGNFIMGDQLLDDGYSDRRPEEGRRDALHASFYVLKNLMIMRYPFAPGAMDRVRESLRLPPEVFRVDELGQPMPAGHEVGPKLTYFPGEAERKPKS